MQITLERQSKAIALSFNTDNSIAYDELYLAVQDKMSAIVNGGKFFVGKAFTIVGNAVSVLSKNIYVQGLTVAAAGGLGSRLAGGSFELGFLTAGLAFAVNQVVTQLAQQKEPLGLTEEEARLVLRNVYHTGGKNNGALRGLPDTLTPQHIELSESMLATTVDLDHFVDLVGDVGLGGARGLVNGRAARGVLKGFFKGAADYDSRREIIVERFDDVGAAARNRTAQAYRRRLDEINLGL